LNRTETPSPIDTRSSPADRRESRTEPRFARWPLAILDTRPSVGSATANDWKGEVRLVLAQLRIASGSCRRRTSQWCTGRDLGRSTRCSRQILPSARPLNAPTDADAHGSAPGRRGTRHTPRASVSRRGRLVPVGPPLTVAQSVDVLAYDALEADGALAAARLEHDHTPSVLVVRLELLTRVHDEPLLCVTTVAILRGDRQESTSLPFGWCRAHPQGRLFLCVAPPRICLKFA